MSAPGCAGVTVGIGGSELVDVSRSTRLAHAEIRLFQVALAITAVLMPVHRYDLAIHLLLVATGWALGSWPRAVVSFVLVMAHGWSTSICWHLWERFGIAVDYHALAGYIAAAQLLILVAWWYRDASRDVAWAVDETRAGVRVDARS